MADGSFHVGDGLGEGREEVGEEEVCPAHGADGDRELCEVPGEEEPRGAVEGAVEGQEEEPEQGEVEGWGGHGGDGGDAGDGAGAEGACAGGHEGREVRCEVAELRRREEELPLRGREAVLVADVEGVERPDGHGPQPEEG